jgi:hypothetical protein
MEPLRMHILQLMVMSYHSICGSDLTKTPKIALWHLKKCKGNVNMFNRVVILTIVAIVVVGYFERVPV